MRAATLILGAVAAASILIALALILSGGDSSMAVTKTVTEVVVEGPAPAASEKAGEGGDAQLGGPTQCGKAVSVENTDCQLGELVHDEYVGGHRGDFFPTDPETGVVIEFFCEDASQPVTCRNEATGAVVYFGK